MRHVLFRLRGERFAVPLSAVREVVPAPTGYTRVPRAPATIRGVMNLRGRVVTVLDTAALLELPGEGAGTQVLLLDAHRGGMGLLVGQVDGIGPLESFTPVNTRGPAVRTLAADAQGAIAVIDVDGLDAQVARSLVHR
ncbi:MAG: chemotaxis protein CheW [Myxococcaceae bacterium]|nr:chemotaxis protein CheW [Myxococcaceae bacterium]